MHANSFKIVRIRMAEDAMSPERWHEIEDLYHAATDLKPGARASLLEATDPELRREVESLLAHLGPLPDIGVAPHEPDAEAGEQLKPGDLLGAYRIEGRLGTGGMGEVYRASDTQLNRPAAIKILPGAMVRDPERLARFDREARVLAALNHANIVQVYGITEGVSSDSYQVRGIAMELVVGTNIAGPMPAATAVAYARQIASALEAAHERGIVHRDLKPANIMVTPEGVVKVLDFGLARPTTPDLSEDLSEDKVSVVTPGHLILGTAAYMAPEQARGQAIDKRADIWAFGVVLYEIVSGKRLFRGETIPDILAAVMTQEPDLSAVPVSLRRLIQRCLEKDPKKRLRDIGDWEQLIDRDRAGETGKRPVAWMALCAVAVLGMIGLGAFYLVQARRAAPSLHLTLSLPNSVTHVSALALSPDGRTLLMRIQDKDKEKTGLALRFLDSDQFRFLPNTSVARSPFWSPDGGKIAFLQTDLKLSVMPVGGGPAEVLCEGPRGGGGGSWGSSGVILTITPGNRLLKGSADKTGCTPLTGPGEKTGTGVNHVSPSFLPDGKHFLFHNRSHGVYVASLDDPVGKRVLPDDTNAFYAPGADGRGYLLFRRDGALVGQRFDPGSLTLSGDVFRIADDASLDGNAELMASAAANGVLVYGTGANPNTQMAWLDRAGKVQSVLGPVQHQSGVMLSADGGQILVIQEGSNLGLWVRNVDREGDSKVAWLPCGCGVAWSPDGKRLAYVKHGDFFTRDLTGSGADQFLLAHNGNSKFLSDWSRDGRYIVYTENGAKTNGDIWVLPDPGSGSKPFVFQQTEADETQAQVSPDGKWMAYASNESGIFEVYVKPFPSGPGRWKISTAGGDQPRWRNDSRELYYRAPGAPNSRIIAVPVKAGTDRSFSAGEPQFLFEHRFVPFAENLNRWSYSVIPDGQRFLVLSKPDSQEAVHVISNWTQTIEGRK